MGCCECFGFAFAKKPKKVIQHSRGLPNNTSQEFLLDEETGDEEDNSYDGDMTDTGNVGESDFQCPTKRSEEILMQRVQSRLVCREFPVKETHIVLRSEDENENKMVNEYVRERKIGAGSYGKVNLYRSCLDGKHYAIKVFHKYHLLKLRVGPSETAMTDVFREVLIMKVLGHPNIVNLIEVIDDPTADHFYMVLEYVEGKWVCEDTGPAGSLGEDTARKYLRDIVSGLMYLHAHNIVHGDIKPDNLLITCSGTVKIGDFSVSQVFEGDNDELRRSPGTPVFTAPECCLGVTYSGKAADTWAVGVTLYCMVLGNYPFLGETLQDTYDKIVNNPLLLPDDMNPLLKNLLEGLLCKVYDGESPICVLGWHSPAAYFHIFIGRISRALLCSDVGIGKSQDPTQRMTLENVSQHEWVVGGDGLILEYLCWCKRNSLEKGVSAETDVHAQT